LAPPVRHAAKSPQWRAAGAPGPRELRLPPGVVRLVTPSRGHRPRSQPRDVRETSLGRIGIMAHSPTIGPNYDTILHFATGQLAI
jgi:hypothetical protein